jgi:hypothetical protein
MGLASLAMNMHAREFFHSMVGIFPDESGLYSDFEIFQTVA